MPVYNAKVVEWHDGDTVKVQIHLLMDLPDLDINAESWLTRSVRLAGCNADELHSKDPAIKASAEAALAYAQSIVPTGTMVTVETTTRRDKYERTLGDVRLPTGADVSELMIQSGHAKPWDGKGPKPV